MGNESYKTALVTTRPIPYLHQASSVLRKLPSELLSVVSAGIIYHTCNLVFDIKYTRYKKAFNKRRIVCQNKSARIYSEKIITVCNAVWVRSCIKLMHILLPELYSRGIQWLPSSSLMGAIESFGYM